MLIMNISTNTASVPFMLTFAVNVEKPIEVPTGKYLNVKVLPSIIPAWSPGYLKLVLSNCIRTTALLSEGIEWDYTNLKTIMRFVRKIIV